MAYDNEYGGVIWTKHALKRLKQRNISQGDAWATWKRPDQSRYASTKSAWVYYKTWGEETVEVVCKQNERKEWIVLSVWSRPAEQIKRRDAKPTLLTKVMRLFSKSK